MRCFREGRYGTPQYQPVLSMKLPARRHTMKSNRSHGRRCGRSMYFERDQKEAVVPGRAGVSHERNMTISTCIVSRRTERVCSNVV
jgi:hypothetical protein